MNKEFSIDMATVIIVKISQELAKLVKNQLKTKRY